MWNKTLGGIIAFLLMIIGVLWLVGSGHLFDDPELKIPAPAKTLPTISESEKLSVQRGATDKQILFGDLHVHTSYSLDAAIFDTPAVKDMGYTTPVDACDFARYCSSLDFWSINDHAEGMTPWQWNATKQAIRQCNNSADPSAPDMVSFLGWEWTQGSTNRDPTRQWGHKNVIFRDIEEGKVPARPIAADVDNVARMASQYPTVVRGLAMLAMSKLDLEGYETLTRHLSDLAKMEDCPAVASPDMPSNCYELAKDPNELFEKLDQWGMEAMVIPHGLAWGTTNPIGADFKYQMAQLNDKYQRLVEINSGHGNSEIYKDLDMPLAGDAICPAPRDNYTPCCWQAGEIIRDRCEANGNDTAICESRAAQTRELFLANMNPVSQFSKAKEVVPETNLDDWGTCDQLVGEFQSAYNYQPKQSAQYMLTLGDENNRFRPGFIGSSDNHSAKAGNSYKELNRTQVTDVKEAARSRRAEKLFSKLDIPIEEPDGGLFPDKEDLGNAFYFTSGLVAVHSANRDRDSIWDALYRREVYGTSGPRISLWFDMLAGEKTFPMGSEVYSGTNPTFKVKAMGSIKQKSGCPDSAVQALGAERIESLCLGECFNPSDEAHNITRLEIVKVTPRVSEDEKTSDLIQDPWQVFECAPGSTSCEAEFTDADFRKDGREAAYYVRAIQEATPTIQGDPLGCEYNDAGECMKTNYCMGDGETDDCISPAEHRAWSSPIYLMPKQS